MKRKVTSIVNRLYRNVKNRSKGLKDEMLEETIACQIEQFNDLDVEKTKSILDKNKDLHEKMRWVMEEIEKNPVTTETVDINPEIVTKLPIKELEKIKEIYPMTISMIIYHRQGEPMYKWLASLDGNYIQRFYSKGDLFAEKGDDEETKTAKEDLFNTAITISHLMNRKIPIHKIPEVMEKLKITLTIESLRRLNIVEVIDPSVEYTYNPKSRIRANPNIRTEEAEDGTLNVHFME